MGAVIQLKGEREHPEGEDTTGFHVRALADFLEGFEKPEDVIRAVVEFNDSLEIIEITTEKPSGVGVLQGVLAGLFE